MIKLNQVRKVYKTKELETTALNAVDLEIKQGEFVAVMGPSGCGKSSLLNVVGMIDTLDGGDYFFDEQNIAELPESKLVKVRRKHLGFIFQSFNLIEDLSVYENVELPLLYLDVPKPQRKNRVREVLELVGLDSRIKHRPAQLSGGQQQRVAVARAVVTDPKLILADEPTGNLDSKNGEDVMEMLTVLNEQGATIMMVTHSAEHAAKAHRVINMLDGKVV
ncbi:MAG: ABC transporter ATP-binding protein [Steroidobacteraceae bacterium]